MEQRNLAQKPQVSWQSWFSGTFSKEFDAYYADTFPLRDFFGGVFPMEQKKV